MITASLFLVAGAALLLLPGRRRRRGRVEHPKNEGIWVERKPQDEEVVEAA